MALRTAVAATALILAGIGSASAQTFVVDDAYGSYGAPAYGFVPGPVYPAPVVVVPRVYVIPQPLYAVPPIAPPYWGGGGGVVAAPQPWTTGVGYPEW